MGRDTHHIYSQFFYIDIHQTICLDSIGMKIRLMLLEHLAYFFDRLLDTCLIIHIHDGNEHGIFRNGFCQIIERNFSVTVHRQVGDIKSLFSQALYRVECSMGRKSRVIEDYFAQIDTPMKAYLLGLLAADGNVYVDTRRHDYKISLKLHRADEVLVARIQAV